MGSLKMRYSQLLSILMLAGCSEATFSADPGSTTRSAETQLNSEEAIERVPPDAAPQSPSGGPSEPKDKAEPPESPEPKAVVLNEIPLVPKDQTFSIDFNLSEQVTATSSSKDIDLIFAIDNSNSMANKMARLKNSLSAMITLIASKTQNKINFSFIKLSDYQALYSNGCCDFNQGAVALRAPSNVLFQKTSNQWLYEKDHISSISTSGRYGEYPHLFLADVTHANLSQIQTQIANFLTVVPFISSEPLISASMEYLNFRSFSDSASAKRFASGGAVHILSLSDEDNDPDNQGRGAAQSLAYQTDHYYASVPAVEKSACSARNLEEPGEEGKAYVVTTQTFCRKQGVLADSEIRGTSYKCESPIMQDPLWTNPLKYVVTGISYNGSKYCKSIPTWDCKRKIDGAETTLTNLASRGTLKSIYSSCTAAAAQSISLFSENDLIALGSQDVWAPAPSECQPITCDLAAERLYFNATRDSNLKVTSITERSCAAGYQKADLGPIAKTHTFLQFSGGALQTSFCSKELPAASRALFPPTLTQTTQTIAGSNKVNTLFYIGLKDPATSGEVLTAFKKALIQSSTLTQSFLTDQVMVVSQPTLPRQGFLNSPEGFLDFAKVVHPEKRITWHTIANLDNQACPGDATASGNISRGTAYIALSDATKGFKGNICDSSFDSIVADLADQVISSSLTTDYDMATLVPTEDKAKLDTASIKAVYNETKGRILPASSYSYANGKMTFTLDAGSANDKIRVEFAY